MGGVPRRQVQGPRLLGLRTPSPVLVLFDLRLPLHIALRRQDLVGFLEPLPRGRLYLEGEGTSS